MKPKIDLNSPYFEDPDYEEIKTKIRENVEKYTDIKILDKYVYTRVEQYTGEELQEQNAWKLCVTLKLREKLIYRVHDPQLSAHEGFVRYLNYFGEISTGQEWLGMFVNI